MIDHAAIWRSSMAKAGALHPDRIAAAITAEADNGLRAARYDSTGGRTTFVACEEPEHCHDGPAPHSHPLFPDPTGNAVADRRHVDNSLEDRRLLDLARIRFVAHAQIVLDWVCGETPHTWRDVVVRASGLNSGTVGAALDQLYAHRDDPASDLPKPAYLTDPIRAVEQAVEQVAAIHRRHQPRTPSTDERNWTAGLADEDCCSWHLSVHRRYRRPRVKGKNICQACLQLSMLGGAQPPLWLIEAEVDRESQPRKWQASLSRWLDELGVPAHRRSAS